MGDEIVNGKVARKFVSKFIQPGLVQFSIGGKKIVSLLRRETIENALGSLINCGVRIGHRAAAAHGAVQDAARNMSDNWFECAGVLDTEDAVKAAQEGGSVSCAYRVNSTKGGGTLNNVPYDEEITDITFTHLAIVDKTDARYEDAVIVLNTKEINPMKNPIKWIISKLDGDKPVEQTGEIPADDTRMNSLVELYRAKNKATIPAGAFVEIDGKRVPMSELLALEVTNTAETPEAKATREKAEADAAKAKEDERNNARRDGYNAFLDVAHARQSAATQTADAGPRTSPDTLDHRVSRGRDLFGAKAMSKAGVGSN